MRILLMSCAFSAFLNSVICQPSSASSSQRHSRPKSEIIKPELVLELRGFTEVLFWRKGQLFFADTYAYKLCSYHEDSRNTYCATLEAGLLSFAVPVKGHYDLFVVGLNKKILLITWNSFADKIHPSSIVLKTVDATIPGNRLNCGTVDNLGRLVFGSTNINGNPLANVSSLSYDLDVATCVNNVVSSVGIVLITHTTFSPKAFVIDSKTNYNIDAYIYHPTPGKFGTKSVVFNWPQQRRMGHPRRLTVDKNGHLWVPIYEGGGVIQVDPRIEKVIDFFPIPAARVGACIFGGLNSDILYVSTIGYGHELFQGIIHPNDKGGSIFALRGLGVQGWPEKEYKLKNVFVKQIRGMHS
ncbi:regucalcin-like [Belonocnema kinseyi]|uniref:regucalcin-like n=1 Tax=Belonocnema kinseyi TaxID=2817044 RepID=UPI00143CC7D3|nr:regucalcin-like [Belonocnema kinseyi]